MPKRDLVLIPPVLNAAGILGFAPDPRAPINWEDLGAFVTNPISLRPRKPAEHPAVLEYPGGFLFHTGLPNPGLHHVLGAHRLAWQQSRLPVIVHLMADRPDEARAMVRLLEESDSAAGIQLGFAPLLADDLVALSVEMCLGELPVVVCLPPDRLLQLGPRLASMGASAICIAAPRGARALRVASVSGRLFGPSLLPQSLELVRQAAEIGIPVIGSVGIFNDSDVDAMLAAGALAVELDAVLWLPRRNEKSLVA